MRKNTSFTAFHQAIIETTGKLMGEVLSPLNNNKDFHERRGVDLEHVENSYRLKDSAPILRAFVRPVGWPHESSLWIEFEQYGIEWVPSRATIRHKSLEELGLPNGTFDLKMKICRHYRLRIEVTNTRVRELLRQNRPEVLRKGAAE